jgi:hypothetical protein
MSTSSKSRLGLALVGAAALTVVTLASHSDDPAETQATEHLVNQVWINRLPQDSRDLIDHLVLLRSSHGRIGGVGRSSQWRHFWELFQWGLEGEHLKLYFPQENAKGAVKVRTWSCKGEAPEPFELCLEVSSGQRTAHYYSLEEWVIDPDDLDASMAQLAMAQPELAVVVQSSARDALEARPMAEMEPAGELHWP